MMPKVVSSVLMYSPSPMPGRGISVRLQPQDPHSPSAEASFVSSSPRSTSSKRSSRNWYHRTSSRLVPDLAAGQHPNRLRGISSIKELARKTSRSVLNQNFLKRGSASYIQTDSDQQHASVTHLPGSPEGPECCPSIVVLQDSNHSSLDSLTPDQSAISNDSSPPLIPVDAQAHHSILSYDKDPLNQEMGNIDSKLASVRVGKTILKGKRSRQTIESEDSIAPTMVPEQALEQLTESVSKQSFADNPALLEEPRRVEPRGTAKRTADPVGPPPVLRHRASFAQTHVPRRRSSLTALHLDSSHFEKPSSSTNSEGVNRVTSFSASLHPVISSPPDTELSSPNARGDKPDGFSSPKPLSPSSPVDLVSSTASSVPPTTTLKQSCIYFPQTWPHGAPEVKPAQLTPNHYSCYRLHQPIRSERAMFNQVPCMTCGIDDKQRRYSCMWCELRVCEHCMRQLDSVRTRPLTHLVQWIAANEDIASVSPDDHLLEGEDMETSRQEKVNNDAKVEIVERPRSSTKSGEALKETESKEQHESRNQSKGMSLDVENVSQLAGGIQEGISSVSNAESSKEAARPTKHTNSLEELGTPAENVASIGISAGGQAIIPQDAATQMESPSFERVRSKDSWSSTKADQVLRDSRGW